MLEGTTEDHEGQLLAGLHYPKSDHVPESGVSVLPKKFFINCRDGSLNVNVYPCFPDPGT